MAGAAWSVPIVVASTTTPAFAASTTELTLLWTTIAAPVPVNTVFGTSEVTVANAEAGAQVTFTLSAGLLWADNTSAAKLVTIVGGKATLPPVKALAVGSHTVTALVGTVSAPTTLQATVVAAPSGNRIYNFTTGTYAVSPTPMVEMIVGADWITVRSDDSRWTGYAYATNIFRPIQYGGQPLVIDGDINTNNSNIFYGLSNGEIYQANLGAETYNASDNGKPVTASRRGAPAGGIATWAANGTVLYATNPAGEWFTNNNNGTTWTKVAVAYPSGQIDTAYAIEGGSLYGWALTRSGDVWWNQGSTNQRTNALSPMAYLSIGTTVVYGAGTDNKWYAKSYASYTTNWTKVQYGGSDFVLQQGERVGHAMGSDWSFVVRGDRSIYRTQGGGTAATQTAELIMAPAGIRDIVLGSSGWIMIAGDDGKVYQYISSWKELSAKGASADSVQVGYRCDGANYPWSIGKS